MFSQVTSLTIGGPRCSLFESQDPFKSVITSDKTRESSAISQEKSNKESRFLRFSEILHEKQKF